MLIYNTDNYVKRLFYKECFIKQNCFSTQDTKEYLVDNNLKNLEEPFFGSSGSFGPIYAFEPIVKLQSDKELQSSNESYYCKIVNYIRKCLNNSDNDIKVLSLRAVPLPEFTKHKIKQKRRKLIHRFIPKSYQNDENLLSPFSRMILYNSNDDIFDNPTIKAIIDFRWSKIILSLFIETFRFYCFAFSLFSFVSSYMIYGGIGISNFDLVVIFIFYYLAIYLFIAKVLKHYYQFGKKRVRLSECFSIIPIVIPTVIFTIILIRYFRDENNINTILIYLISFSCFIVLIEAVSICN